MLNLTKINELIADINAELPVIPLGPLKSKKPKTKLNKTTKALMGKSDFTDETEADLRSALASMPSDDRETWVAFGQALMTVPVEGVGFKLWIEWSQKSAKYDEADAIAKWHSFSGERTNYQAVFTKAQEMGWVNPKSKQALMMGTGNRGTIDAPRLQGLSSRHGTKTTRPLTESGNAARMSDLYANNLFYVPSHGWIYWNGNSWLWDIDAAICRSLAARLPGQILTEALDYMSDVTLFANWSLNSQKIITINAAVSLLKDSAQMRLPVSLLNANNFAVGFDNASKVIDLKTGMVRAARQDDFITKTLGVETVGEASKAIKWIKFLSEVFDGDSELIDWMQRWCGYSMTGSVKEHLIIFCFGGGRNGKSVFCETLNKIMGEYACGVDIESFLEGGKKNGSDASPDIARLVNIRAVLSTEAPEGRKLNEGRIKSISAGDKQTARNLHQSPFDFSPQLKLTLVGNHKPTIRGTDRGIWSRIALIPFTRNFEAEGVMDVDLRDKLWNEAPHILAWLIDGCLKWQKRGLGDLPKAVRNSTLEYQKEQDVVGIWIEECCISSVTEKDSIARLFRSYQSWAEESGVYLISKLMLAKKLRERGYADAMLDGARALAGVRVKTYDEQQH
ncbi:MAG: phage/plasmid primase, P4 family [Methylococcaceae bacterium]